MHYVETDVADSRRDAQHSWPKELCVCVCVCLMTLKTHTLRFFIASTQLQKQGMCSILFFFFDLISTTVFF